MRSAGRGKTPPKRSRIEDGSSQRVQVLIGADTYFWYRTVAAVRGVTMQMLFERALEEFRRVYQ